MAAVAAAVLLCGSAAGEELFFNDSAKVNIMRQFDVTWQWSEDVTTRPMVSGYAISRSGTGDFHYEWTNRAPWQIGAREGGSYLTDVNTASSVITLPSEQTIGSFSIQFSPSYQQLYPYQWVLEGYNDTRGWFPIFDTLDDERYASGINSYNINGTFADATVSKVKYTAIGTAGGAAQYNYALGHLNLYLSAGQQIPLYGSGYSLIHDTSRVVSSATSPHSGAWRNPAFNGYMATNGNYESYEIKAQGAAEAYDGLRAYVSWNFDQAYQMDFAVLAGVYDYSITNWELYTINTDDPAALFTALNALEEATVEAIQSLGWTLQYQYGEPGGWDKDNNRLPTTPASGLEHVFDFVQPGEYQYLLFVQDTQHPAWGQLEVYANAVPEPATMGLLVLGGLAMLRRRK